MINVDKHTLKDFADYAALNHLERIPERFYDCEQNIIHFFYPIQKLADEVYKRTSYIGMSRVNENGQSLLDIVAMGRDEGEMFEPFLRDAMAATFEAFVCFSQDMKAAYLFDEGAQSYDMKENFGHVVTINLTNPQYDSAAKSITLSYNIQSNPTLDSDEEIHLAISVDYNVINSMSELEKRVSVQEFVFDSSSMQGSLTLPVVVEDAPSVVLGVAPEQFAGIDAVNHSTLAVKKKNPKVITKGTWINYEKLDGTKKFYIANIDTDENQDLNNPVVYRYVPFDYRHSVHYIIRQPVDINVQGIEMADTSIYESLVTYIMWRWLSVIFPAEAQLYFDMFLKRQEEIRWRLNYRNRGHKIKGRYF